MRISKATKLISILIGPISVASCLSLNENSSRVEYTNIVTLEYLNNLHEGKYKASGNILKSNIFPKSMNGYCGINLHSVMIDSIRYDLSQRASLTEIPQDSIDFDCIIGPSIAEDRLPTNIARFKSEIEALYEKDDVCLGLDRFIKAVEDFGSQPLFSDDDPIYPREAFYVAGMLAGACGSSDLSLSMYTKAAALGDRSALLEIQSISY